MTFRGERNDESSTEGERKKRPAWSQDTPENNWEVKTLHIKYRLSLANGPP